MISRRNIRIKVMQALYANEASSTVLVDKDLKQKALKSLDQKIQSAANLFTLNLLYIASVARFAEKDAAHRSAKLLPSTADLNVSTKIANNTFLWELLDNDTFKAKTENDKLNAKLDNEWVKKIYQQLTTSDAYLQYIADNNRDKKNEKDILLHIWQQEMLANEDFQEYLSDEYDNWDDDKEMTEMLIGNYFRNNKGMNFLKFISAEKKEYADTLLTTFLEKEDYCMELISPKLQNWDPERVAAIDIILLKMGVCEFLYFPTIPTKVTINEYIDIAKNYSTPQSGQFVNGVLDNLLKDLIHENKVRKVDRR